MNDSDRVFVHQFAKLTGGLALLTVVLSEIVTSVGLVPEQPGGPLTVNVYVAVRVELVPVPVTVSG